MLFALHKRGKEIRKEKGDRHFKGATPTV